MRYTKPDCAFLALSSSDVITASDLSGKLTQYDLNDEDTLKWARNI